MSISRSENANSAPQPPRMPLRWVIILIASTAVGVVLGVTSNAGVGVLTAIALATLLHAVLE
jgi:hypothetical protein